MRGEHGRIVSLSAFSFLFSEIIQHESTQIKSGSELERRLEDLGHRIGLKFYELCSVQEGFQRCASAIAVLQFISSTCWQVLYGQAAESLERSTENDNEYMIYDRQAITNKYISVTSGLGHLDCAAFVAGITAGLLDAASFPATVSAHTNAPTSGTTQSVFLIKFHSS